MVSSILPTPRTGGQGIIDPPVFSKSGLAPTNKGTQTVSTPQTQNTSAAPVKTEPIEANVLAQGIIGEQAVGTPNIRTQTGRTDPDKIEMLYDPVKQDVQEDEFLDTPEKLVDEDSRRAATTTASVPDDIQVSKKDAVLVDEIERASGITPDAEAAVGTVSDVSQIDIDAVVDERTKEAMLSRGSLADSKTQDLVEEASVAYQIEKLTEGIETGNFPPWASPTIRKINEIMNQRGLCSSGMAAAALAQGLIESAIPIASADAQKAATLQIQNLNNEQQTALANAASIAALDRQNLDNRMKAAQTNAQSFLKMDLQNTTQEQQANVLTHQSKIQALFTDQAAENVRLNTNAKTENEVNQFYDSLGATVAKNNADRESAINQFNTKESNAISIFNEKLSDSRDKFNSNMRQQIDQFNTNWRRSVNTVNNTNQNRANQMNAASLLGITLQAQNNLWQKYRDDVSFIFTASENELQRNQNIAITALNNESSANLLNSELDFKDNQASGSLVGTLLSKLGFNIIDRVFPTK